MLVDTHAHLDDLKYEEDRQEVIARAKAEGTTRIITMGDTMESSFNAIKIADNFDGVFAGAGVHPQEALSIQSSKDYDTLAELMTLPKVKVLGEIGLDYYYENAPREVQHEVFIRQLDVARQMHMPVSIHDRDAHGDTMAILKKEGKGLTGSIHCFSGSYEMAKELLKMGWFLGVDGPLTFKNSAKLPEIVAKIPLERLLLETDCPYLAPVPKRELELDKLGDRKTALFLIMSDTDSTFNFLISMIYTQLFNLLCDKADDVYGGKLPVHVRCLIDECANIGQIPQLEKLVATIRSREISACLVLQTRSQLKAIYKDNADTIVGNMDSQIFLGGSEPTTLKELSEALGKETIDSYNNSDTRGNSPSYGTNYQKLGHELLSRDEIAVLDGDKCILQLRGVRPFLSDKYDLTQHPNYKYTSDYDPKNALDIEKFLNRKEKIHPDDTFIMVDADSLPPA